MLVTKTLLKTLSEQVEKHGTVVWYDPSEAYAELQAGLSTDAVAGAAIHRYTPERGFMALRQELETHWRWEHEQPPRLIIYAPVEQTASHHALIEYEVAGVVLRPGQQPRDQDTALGTVARRAFQHLFPAAKVEELVEQVVAGQLTLADLDGLAERGQQDQSGVIVTVFGTGNPVEVAMKFLADNQLDTVIEKRGAASSLKMMFEDALGISFSDGESMPTLRYELARQILVTDFITELGAAVPSQLDTFNLAGKNVARETAVEWARQWRNRRDTAASYRDYARRIESDFGIREINNIPLEALAKVETFRSAATKLQAAIEMALRERATEQLIDIIRSRRDSFWSESDPTIKTRWAVILDAGLLLLQAQRIEDALKSKRLAATDLVQRYAIDNAGEEAWSALDTAQRHLERDFHNFELVPGEDDSLLQLVSLARQRYGMVSGELAARFSRAYADAAFELKPFLPQTDIFANYVDTHLPNEKVAYMLVDALRYEMARELLKALPGEWQADLVPALATPPTITEIGMAALMPGAEKGITITNRGGKLVPLIDGTELPGRAERVKLFERRAADKAVTVKLEELTPLTNQTLIKKIDKARVVLVTATEQIDGLCESNPDLARRMLDDVLNQLRRAMVALFGQGIQHIVVTADHGYLFGEEIDTGQTIDSPGGNAAILKRRVWVGKGGAMVPGTLRQPLSAFGIGGDLELVTPENLAVFKAPGGATSYFHGGLSLQELVIPVLTVSNGGGQASNAEAEMAWELKPNSERITTRFISVNVSGRSTYLLPVETRAVRVEVRAGSEVISNPVVARYGFQEATKDVVMEPKEDEPRSYAENDITLQITAEPDVNSVTIHLIDAKTGASLQRVENVPFEIVF